jgi:hypothetical protein
VVVIQQPSPQVLKLPPGSTLETVVLLAKQQRSTPPPQQTPDAETPDTETRQTVTLRTSKGDVTVRTAVPLESGAKVALEILRSTPNQVTARIVTIDGQAPQQAAREALSASMPAALPDKAPSLPNPTQGVPLQPGQAWTPQGPAPLTSLMPLSAFVIKGPITPQVQAAAQTALQQTTLQQITTQIFQPGTDVGLRVVNLQMPTIGAPLSALPAATAPTVPQAVNTQANAMIMPAQQGVQGPSGAAKQNPSLQTQTQPNPLSTNASPQAATVAGSVQVPLQATESPGLKLPTPHGFGPITPAPPQSVEALPVLVRMTGQVTAVAPNGAVIVQTPAGEMQLNARANVPVGSTLTFEILTSTPPRADTVAGGTVPPAPSPAQAGLPLSTPTMGWGSVTEALQLLQRTDPQAATHLAAAIPDGGPRTAVAAMAFVAAMKSGDARQWPGDTALRGLERAGARGAQLAAQISGEVRELAQRTADTGSEWRTLPMPWNAGGEIDRIALIMRREGDSDEDANRKGGRGKGTRFLINLDLTKMGELQLDGMFRKADRAFDMMIRTKDALPDNIRRDLAGLFANSNAAMGLKGALSFQVVKRFPDPTAAGPAADRGGLWA